jgi:ubiquinone/menaquinone biosynthesis C-methylase UbiE
MSQSDPTGFSRVDATVDPRAYLHYLDVASAQASVQEYKRRTFDLLELQEGESALDIGCGVGDDARALATRVSPSGRVVGIDSSATMIAEAQSRSEGAGLPVEFRVGDAHQLDLPESQFHGCRADRTFQHLADPRRALAELIRVARPGARIVVSDPDWDTLVLDVPDRALTRRIVDLHSDGVRNGWIGRQLPGLFKEQGLTEVAVATQTFITADLALASNLFELWATAERARTSGTIPAEEIAAWWSHLEQAASAGRFFAALTGFIVSGRKP